MKILFSLASLLIVACTSLPKIEAQMNNTGRIPAQDGALTRRRILTAEKVLVSKDSPENWFEQFQDFLEPSQKIFGAFNVSDLKLSMISISWGSGRLSYNPSSPSILEIGWPHGCKSSSSLQDSFILSMHEVGHILLDEYLKKTYIALYSKDQKMDFLGPVMSMSDISKPYEEVFADAFVVFAYLDPNIMTNAINACGIETIENTNPNTRSFSREINLNNWQDKSLHSVFDPTRVYLYRDLYLKLLKGDAPKLMKILAESIGALIAKKRLANVTREDWKSFHASILNKEFISKINEQLKAQ